MKTPFEKLNPSCREIRPKKVHKTNAKDLIFDLPLKSLEKMYNN